MTKGGLLFILVGNVHFPFSGQTFLKLKYFVFFLPFLKTELRSRSFLTAKISAETFCFFAGWPILCSRSSLQL